VSVNVAKLDDLMSALALAKAEALRLGVLSAESREGELDGEGA
jgi:hypothetical protein